MLNFAEQTADNYSVLATSLIPIRPCVNPNVPPGTTHLHIAPNALFPWYTMPMLWHVHGELDETRLVEAIGELTSWWPVLGARYVRHPASERDMPNLALHLTSSPIPYQRAEHRTSRPPFANRNVVQPTLDPYMPSLAPDFLWPDYDAPLVAIRHTVLRPANESIFAICISHIMVDGDSLSRLAHHLSFLYDSPGSVLDQPPTFLARIQWGSWPPSKEVIEANRLDLSRLCDTPSAQLAVGARMIGSTEAITIPLSGAEVVYLKQTHGVEGGSSTDAICGWLTDLLERVGEVTKPQLSTVVNYRTWQHASGLIPRDLINQYNTAAIIVSVPSDHSPAPSRARHVAQMIRSSINRYKTDPGSILAELTMRSCVLQTAAESGKILAFGAAPGQLTFNSTTRYDWHPTFGFGKRSAVHTVWTSPRYLRIWRSNPVVGEEDAAWDGSVEISFAVGPGVKASLGQLLEA